MGKIGFEMVGVSPYFSAVSEFEQKFFVSAEQRREVEAQSYEDNVKSRISKVIANYKTGLDDADSRLIPGLILEQSRKYGYDPLFLTAVIVTESSFYNWAKSDRGALGLMQIRPMTGSALAEENQIEWEGQPTLYDPETNIALGTYYLYKLTLRYGDLALALEAYNRGPSELDRHLRHGQRPEGYSKRVLNFYKEIGSQSV